MLPSSFDIQKNVAGSIEQTSTLSDSRPEFNTFIMLGQFKKKVPTPYEQIRDH